MGTSPVRANWASPSIGEVMNLLVVEDDDAIGQLLESGLRANGYRVTWHRLGAEAAKAAQAQAFDLILLDLGLPDRDGVALCRDLRMLLPTSVIVMLTARRDEMDVVAGLESGADDYLTKPFGLVELLARVRAHLEECADCMSAYECDLLLKALVRRSCGRVPAPDTLRVSIVSSITTIHVGIEERRAVDEP